MNRRALVAGAALLALLVSSGCAPAPADWEPPRWAPTELRVREAPPPIDPETLPMLIPQRLRNPSLGIQARFVYLPGERFASFNARLDGFLRDVIAQRSAETGRPYAPAVGGRGAGLAERGCAPGSTLRPAAELLADRALGAARGIAIVCDVVAASGSVFGERMRVLGGDAARILRDDLLVLYADTATGEIATGGELWSSGAADALHERVVDAVRRHQGSLSLQPLETDPAQLAAIQTALESTIPTGQGMLAFTLSAGFRVPTFAATAEPLTIEVPREEVVRLATPFGIRVAIASGTPFQAPEAVLPSAEWVDCSLLPCVALTYDDGPSRHTPRLLDHLAVARAPATFYMLGGMAQRNPDTVRRAAAEGHEIGSHTWSHPNLRTLTRSQIRSQLGRTQRLLQSLSGQPITSFRPPYGEFSRRVLRAAGMPAILWTVDPRDWEGSRSEHHIIRHTVTRPRPGWIVLYHDTSPRTVRATPEIVAGLRDRGFTLVTVTTLFGGQLPASGAWRSAPADR